jgi:ubiquinone/menaquinone biosynthesis C-methylase UbiE
LNDDKAFAGTIPDIYERLLVPMLFEPYADDLAARVAQLNPGSVLELAAGTGVVTSRLARMTSAHIVATDLNPDMIEQAPKTDPNVEWRPADALALPFADETFDAVVCQFGVMFFPDRPKAYSEARRVLKPGGIYLFNTWGGLPSNEFAETVHDAVEGDFLGRTPYSYYDPETIARELQQEPSIETVEKRSLAKTAEDVAVAFCAGTPLATELGDQRDAAIRDATKAVEQRFGPRDLDARMQALVVSVRRQPD